jgi:hypothetical protein
MMLSIILTGSVLFPEMNETVIVGILGYGGLLAAVTTVAVLGLRRDDRDIWRATAVRSGPRRGARRGYSP